LNEYGAYTGKFGIGPGYFKADFIQNCVKSSKDIVSYAEIFLDAQVSNLVKEITSILELMLV
jgi:hypothetical protein